MPDDLISQLPIIKEVIKAYNLSIFEQEGFEADDLIATLAEKFKTNPDIKITILTGDMDTAQLVEGEKVVVRVFKKGITETVIYDDKAVEERYGLRPNQMIDYKALVGDPSDNIKGVPGIGPKTATELIKKFGSLEEVYRAAAVDPKLGIKLLQFKDVAMLSKHLVTLKRDVPVEVDLEDLAIKEDSPEIKKYFQGMGFKTLINRLHGDSVLPGVAARKPKSRNQPIF